MPFSQVLAEAAAEKSWIEPMAAGLGTGRLHCQLTILATGEVRAPSADARSCYLDESAVETTVDSDATMRDAARRLEAMVSSRWLSAAELRKLRREAAMFVHPDLCAESDKPAAEELMKGVNLLVAAALELRHRS